MNRIKIKETDKGTIKKRNPSVRVLQKSKAIHAQMKIGTKADKEPEEGQTSVNSATDSITDSTRSAGRKGIILLNKRGSKAQQETRKQYIQTRLKKQMVKASRQESSKQADTSVNDQNRDIGCAAKEFDQGNIKGRNNQTEPSHQRGHYGVQRNEPVRIKEADRSRNMKTGNTHISGTVRQQMKKRFMKAENKRKASGSDAAKHKGDNRHNVKRKAAEKMASAARSFVNVILAGGWIAILALMIVVVLGAAVTFFGNMGSESYIPVSKEVEQYEDEIIKYAKEAGIAEYADLIKAVMMQESGGKGSDPMQASECAYNKKYPRVPGGIKDPLYSIQVGTKYLAENLRLAKVKSPIDMDRLRLAVQGYNFGTGFISWAADKYGGYSMAAATEYAEMMAERNGWKSYGDVDYVDHVLRYYPYGRYTYASGGGAIVEIAKSQVGNVGGRPYWKWYGFSDHVDWCACFVSWCADQCGQITDGSIPKFSYCPDGVRWFKEKGRWKGRSSSPEPGMIIFFDWDGNGTAEHVGIVEKYENGMVYTIEGNSGDACRERCYTVKSQWIMGYGKGY